MTVINRRAGELEMFKGLRHMYEYSCSEESIPLKGGFIQTQGFLPVTFGPDQRFSLKFFTAMQMFFPLCRNCKYGVSTSLKARHLFSLWPRNLGSSPQSASFRSFECQRRHEIHPFYCSGCQTDFLPVLRELAQSDCC